jgi:hypothetical protein
MRVEPDADGVVVERFTADRHAHDVGKVRIHGFAALRAPDFLRLHRSAIGTSCGSLESRIGIVRDVR